MRSAVKYILSHWNYFVEMLINQFVINVNSLIIIYLIFQERAIDGARTECVLEVSINMHENVLCTIHIYIIYISMMIFAQLYGL